MYDRGIKTAKIDEVQMANNIRKKCLTSLDIKQMKTKATLIFHFILVIMTETEKTDKNKYWRGYL